jgi:hypothetical protein
MAKTGKTNAGAVSDSAPSLKSRGLKNPMPQSHPQGEANPGSLGKKEMKK